jgi:methyl-accepting chemotaxis protein
MCFIVILMLIFQTIIVELFLFGIINHMMSSAPVKMLPQISGMLIHFNRYYLPVFILTSLVFAMGIFLFLKDVNSPLERIGKISKEIASGDYEKRINVRSGDEFYDLSTNFNILSEKMEAVRDNLTEMVDQLDMYAKIGSRLSNIIESAKYVSPEHEKSLREDGSKIVEICTDIEKKIAILRTILEIKKNKK